MDPYQTSATCCSRLDLDTIDARDDGIDRVPIECFAVQEEAHETPDVTVTIQDELAKTGMLDLHGIDTHPDRFGLDFDDSQAARRPPVAGGNFDRRQDLVLRLDIRRSFAGEFLIE